MFVDFSNAKIVPKGASRAGRRVCEVGDFCALRWNYIGHG